MATQRRAEVEWIGGLMDGEGKIVSTTSGRAARARGHVGRRGSTRTSRRRARRSCSPPHTPPASRCSSRPASSAPAGSPRRCTSPRDGLVRGRHRDHDIGAHRAGDRRRAHRRARSARSPSARRSTARSRGRSPASRSRSTCPTSPWTTRKRSAEDEELASVDADDEADPARRPPAYGPAAAAATSLTGMAAFERLVEELERSYPEAQERHVRSRGLQRPPRGGGGRPAAEGARGRRTSSRRRGGRRATTSRRRGATPSSPRWSPTTRPTSRGSRRSSSSRSSSATPPTRRT